MIDFREWTKEIKEAVRKINNETSNWRWKVTINKHMVKLTNGYIEGQFDKDYFKIESESLNLFLYGPNGEFDGRVIDEGDFEDRLGQLIEEAGHIFNTAY